MATSAPQPSSSEAPRKRGPGCWTIGCGSVLLVSAILIVVAVYQDGRHTRARLRTIDAFRASGDPQTAEAIEALYEDPNASPDVTAMYSRALSQLQELEPDRFEKIEKWSFGQMLGGEKEAPFPPPAIPTPGEPWPDQAQAEATLLARREPLELLCQAGDQKRAPLFSSDPEARTEQLKVFLTFGVALQEDLRLKFYTHLHHGESQAVAANFPGARGTFARNGATARRSVKAVSPLFAAGRRSWRLADSWRPQRPATRRVKLGTR